MVYSYGRGEGFQELVYLVDEIFDLTIFSSSLLNVCSEFPSSACIQ